MFTKRSNFLKFYNQKNQLKPKKVGKSRRNFLQDIRSTVLPFLRRKRPSTITFVRWKLEPPVVQRNSSVAAFVFFSLSCVIVV